jgi:hypothetical protein
LSAGVEQTVKKWKFEPQAVGDRSFELKCEFTLPFEEPTRSFYVEGSLHLVLAEGPVLVQPIEAQKKTTK